jgi:pyruvate,orthophosphate dikinase
VNQPRLDLLRAVRFKPVASAETVGLLTGMEEPEAAVALESLGEVGLVLQTSRGWRLTPDGQTTLATLLADELTVVDTAAVHALHDRFLDLDGELKAVITAHQTSGDSVVSDANVARLFAVHDKVRPIAEEAIALAPRLAHYVPRLDGALVELERGDARYLAHPMVDSYHTVWFEFHEELIHLSGLKRSDVEASSAHQ